MVQKGNQAVGGGGRTTDRWKAVGLAHPKLKGKTEKNLKMMRKASIAEREKRQGRTSFGS